MTLGRKLPFQEHRYSFLSFLKITLEWEKYRRFVDLSEEEIKRM